MKYPDRITEGIKVAYELFCHQLQDVLLPGERLRVLFTVSPPEGEGDGEPIAVHFREIIKLDTGSANGQHKPPLWNPDTILAREG